MRVARPPDQVRPKRHRAQRIGICRQNFALGQSFGEGIGAGTMRGERQLLIDAG
jgi:hypothetical protein